MEGTSQCRSAEPRANLNQPTPAMQKSILLLTASLFLHTAISRTQAAAPDSADGTLSIYFENDLFAGTDRYYTNGVSLSWSSTDLAKFSDTPYASPLLPLLNAIPFVNRSFFEPRGVIGRRAGRA